MNEDLIREAIQARIDIDTWLHNRPNVGLDVSDVEKLVAGFDYLGFLLFGDNNLTIEDKNENS